MTKQAKNNLFFWLCASGTFINTWLAVVVGGVPALKENSQVFAMSAVLFAVGMIANYLNCQQDDPKPPKS
jgi:hypothetical protein